MLNFIENYDKFNETLKALFRLGYFKNIWWALREKNYFTKEWQNNAFNNPKVNK